MSRPFTLFTGQWADLPLTKICELASSWGYDGLELACWGDHFEVDRAISEDGYIAGRHALLAKYGLRCANVFHAGDGNLHPLILYDANKAGELDRAEQFGSDILRLCVEVGGVLTGEHGVGVEKRDLMPTMFSETDLNQQQRLKCAFDDKSLLNPGKVFPTLHRCAELGRMHVHAGRVAFPDLPRF